jgi:hypothetical protein
MVGRRVDVRSAEAELYASTGLHLLRSAANPALALLIFLRTGIPQYTPLAGPLSDTLLS